MAKYEVQWSKRYYASGRAVIEAESKEKAKEIAEERIGDYEGSMQYDADGDDIYILGEKLTKCCGELGMGCGYEGNVEDMTKHPKYDGYLCPKCTKETS